MYIFSPFAFLGLIVNILSIVAMCRDRVVRNTTRLLNLIIASINIKLLILPPLFWHGYARNIHRLNDLPNVVKAFAYLTHYLMRVYTLARSWLLVLVSVERLLCFRMHRLHILPWWNWRRLCWSIPLLFVLAAIVQVPHLSYHALIYSKGTTSPEARFNGVLNACVDLVFNSCGPTVAHLLLAVRFEAKIRRQQAVFSTLSFSLYERAIKGLHLTTATFVAFLLPQIVVESINIPTKMQGWVKSRAYTVAAVIAGVTEVSSIFIASANFFVYLHLSKRFRKTVKEVFSRDSRCRFPQ